jgi:hypothetical protein
MMVQEKVCQREYYYNHDSNPPDALDCLYSIYKQPTQEMDMYSHLLQHQENGQILYRSTKPQ